MGDESIKIAVLTVAALGGGIIIGYMLAPKGGGGATTNDTTAPLYVPACEDLE